MTWPTNPRPAKSLLQLLDEVNALFPNRSKASDGLLGDAAHASRDSDHNPWVKDGTVGVVTAVDITDGPAPGVPEIADFIVATLVKNRDPRVKYLIHEGLIYRSYDKTIDGHLIPAWSPAPYSGLNGHFKHCHVSVEPEKALYDSTASWGLSAALQALTKREAIVIRPDAGRDVRKKDGDLAEHAVQQFRYDWPADGQNFADIGAALRLIRGVQARIEAAENR